MRFRTTIELGGKTATGFEVPETVVTELGAGKRPPVSVNVGQHTYRTTIAPMDGRFLIPLSAENRAAAGVAAGDEVEVELQLDTEPREVTVPADFAAALDRDTGAKRRFESMSYSHKRRWVMSIDDAKTAETRQRRIDKAISEIGAAPARKAPQSK